MFKQAWAFVHGFADGTLIGNDLIYDESENVCGESFECEIRGSGRKETVDLFFGKRILNNQQLAFVRAGYVYCKFFKSDAF